MIGRLILLAVIFISSFTYFDRKDAASLSLSDDHYCTLLVAEEQRNVSTIYGPAKKVVKLVPLKDYLYRVEVEVKLPTSSRKVSRVGHIRSPT